MESKCYRVKCENKVLVIQLNLRRICNWVETSEEGRQVLGSSSVQEIRLRVLAIIAGFFTIHEFFARRLAKHDSCHRASWVTLYLTILDKNGDEFLPDRSGEWEIKAYKSAADEHGA